MKEIRRIQIKDEWRNEYIGFVKSVSTQKGTILLTDDKSKAKTYGTPMSVKKELQKINWIMKCYPETVAKTWKPMEFVETE